MGVLTPPITPRTTPVDVIFAHHRRTVTKPRSGRPWAWMWTRTHVVEGRRVIALDGKTVRGARSRRTQESAPHLVAAFDHAAGSVLGQVPVTARSNEIPAVRDLLASFDLDGAVVTVDAMHTQADTARVITSAGGDYVLTVKSNQPCLQPRSRSCPGPTCPPTAP